MAAVALQPVSVAVASESAEFHSYSSGVMNITNCGTELTHCVVVIGYGTTLNGTDYWYVKNSWGSWWGDNGFFKILRTNQTGYGMCGILMMPSYPVLAPLVTSLNKTHSN